MKTIRLMLALLFIGTSLPLMAVGNDTIVIDNVTYIRYKASEIYDKYRLSVNEQPAFINLRKLTLDTIRYEENGYIPYYDNINWGNPFDTFIEELVSYKNDDEYVVQAIINTNSLHLRKRPIDYLEGDMNKQIPVSEDFFEDTRSDKLLNVHIRSMVEFDGVPCPVTRICHGFNYSGSAGSIVGAGPTNSTMKNNTIIKGDRIGKITMDNDAPSFFSIPPICNYNNPKPTYLPVWLRVDTVDFWPVDTLVLHDNWFGFSRVNWPHVDEYKRLIYPKHLIKYLRLGRYTVYPLTNVIRDGKILDDIDIPDSKWINYHKKGNTIYNRDGSHLVFYKRSLTGEAEIEEGVTHIDPAAFFNSKITSVKFPSSLKVICDSAFNSSAIEEVEIYADMVYDYAFADCPNLRKVSLYNANTVIWGCAFWNCPNLKEVYCYTADPPILRYLLQPGSFVELIGQSNIQHPLYDSYFDKRLGIFGGCGNDITVYVPKYCYERYKNIQDNTFSGEFEYDLELDRIVKPWLKYGDKRNNNSIKIVEMEDYVAEGIDDVSVGERLPSVNVIGREVSVTGASGSIMAEAFDATGRCVYSGHGSSFSLPSSGIYILRINGSTQKIIVK